jgi:hypothetical protein
VINLSFYGKKDGFDAIIAARCMTKDQVMSPEYGWVKPD